jgi:hypothetical protein
MIIKMNYEIINLFIKKIDYKIYLKLSFLLYNIIKCLLLKIIMNGGNSVH